MFERVYRIRTIDVERMRIFVLSGSPNIRNLFTWLIKYINRYQYWKIQAVEAMTATTDAEPSERKNRRKRINQRWMRRVNFGYETFLLYLRRLIKHQDQYGGLRQSTWIKLYFCIRHLNALVRSTKTNYLPSEEIYDRDHPVVYARRKNQYFFVYGRPQAFPNFNPRFYNNNLPRLAHESRLPGDPNILERNRRGLPGGYKGPGGRGSFGGRYGMYGFRGFGGIQGEYVHDTYWDEDSDAEDSARPVDPNEFIYPPPMPRFSYEEADTDDENVWYGGGGGPSPDDSDDSDDSDDDDGGSRPWWATGYDNTGGIPHNLPDTTVGKTRREYGEQYNGGQWSKRDGARQENTRGEGSDVEELSDDPDTEWGINPLYEKSTKPAGTPALAVPDSPAPSGPSTPA
ncbi:hypothetical protein GGR53DRAFT_489366 [Hypoxylon sp. FL1150]|nr:hypothetical protein GGR53DRAFT_489366 [Hypoxylon sp. FL1150]